MKELFNTPYGEFSIDLEGEKSDYNISGKAKVVEIEATPIYEEVVSDWSYEPQRFSSGNRVTITLELDGYAILEMVRDEQPQAPKRLATPPVEVGRNYGRGKQ